MMKSYSVFHIEQKMEFEKFNCFFCRFFRIQFRENPSDFDVVEREYIPDIARQICFAYQLTGFYLIRGYTERYFLTRYSYILENHFYFVYAPDYCSKPSLSRIFCVNSSVKVLSPPYEGPSTHLFRTSYLCALIIYKKKEIGFVAKLFSKYFLGKMYNPELFVFVSSKIQESS